MGVGWRGYKFSFQLILRVFFLNVNKREQFVANSLSSFVHTDFNHLEICDQKFSYVNFCILPQLSHLRCMDSSYRDPKEQNCES